MTNNLNPKNMVLLAVIGIGAYYMMTRKAVAGMTAVGSVPKVASKPPVVYRQNPTAALVQPNSLNTQLAVAGLGILDKLFGRAPVNYSTAPDQTSAEDARLARYESAAVYSTGPDQSDAETARLLGYASQVGEVAYNPPATYSNDPQLYESTGGWLDGQ